MTTQRKGKEIEKERDFTIVVDVTGLLHYFTEPAA